MRVRKPIARETGNGRLLAGGEECTVRYEVITWGTFDDDTLCIQERNGAFEGERAWPSGVAELRLEDGAVRRILLRRSGTFAMCE